MKILIADDDPTTRLLLRRILSQWDFAIQETPDGDEAWRQLTGPEPAPLAVLDWQMPGRSGPELCRALKNQRPGGLPYILLLTAMSSREDIVAGLDAGADDFIIKPFDHGELRARVGVGRRIVRLQEQLIELNRGLEQRVQERTAQVEHLLQYQRDLTVRLGHDLKTPLTPLLSLLPLVDGAQSQVERQELLRLSLEGARSIQATVTRVLELCRWDDPGRQLNFAGVELRDAVAAALALVERSGDRPRRTVSNEVPEGWRVRADLTRLPQALSQLVQNAVQFTAPGGHIALQATAERDKVTLRVTDDGVGLEPQHCERIFEPFYKVDASRHAHGQPGLGLTIARTIVERHGGRLWAESAGPGRGATFCCTLPLASGAIKERP